MTYQVGNKHHMEETEYDEVPEFIRSKATNIKSNAYVHPYHAMAENNFCAVKYILCVSFDCINMYLKNSYVEGEEFTIRYSFQL